MVGFGIRHLAVLSLVAVAVLAASGSHALARYATVVMEADTGRVVQAVNPDTRNYPASLTKIMTLYMMFDALETGRITETQRLPVSATAAGMPPSKIGLRAGETISVRDAMLALITKSANDVAVVVAEALGGTEARFARTMTERAQRLGLKQTTFRNASGLPNNGQLSTARDMAILAQRLMQDFPQYYHLFSTPQFTYRGQTHRNHNALLANYPGTDGMKTGYIRASGYNLVTSVERDGRRLIGVIFGGDSPRGRDRQMTAMLDRAFASTPGIAAPAIAAVNVPPQRPAVASASQGDVSPSDGRWAIQVGAFARSTNAESAAQAASERLGTLARDSAVAIVPSSNQKGSLYRARLTGMSEQTAREACRALRSKRLDCLPIAPSADTVAEGSS